MWLTKVFIEFSDHCDWFHYRPDGAGTVASVIWNIQAAYRNREDVRVWTSTVWVEGAKPFDGVRIYP